MVALPKSPFSIFLENDPIHPESRSYLHPQHPTGIRVETVTPLIVNITSEQ